MLPEWGLVLSFLRIIALMKLPSHNKIFPLSDPETTLPSYKILHA